jgi:hypothetical protein
MKANLKFKRLADKALWAMKISQGTVVTAEKINATFSVKAKGLLVQTFTRMLGAIGMAKTVARVRSILIFVIRCKALYKAQGMKGLVIHLKALTSLIQQAAGGFRLYDCTELKCRPGRTKSGLPKMILAQDRALLRAGNAKIITFYVMLFWLYRILEFPGKLKLNTITDGFKGHMERGGIYFRLVSFIPAFVRMLNKFIKDNKVLALEKRGIHPSPIIKSAPGTAGGQVSTNPFVLVTNAANLKRLSLDSCIEYFIKYFEKGTKIPYPGLLAIFQGAAAIPLGFIPSLAGEVGRLGFKDEPAGKVRVFAMVDAWTQWVLAPFHLFLFDVLRTIEQDGTFDQLRPVREKARSATQAYSLDLTAATDRIPMSIQILLFTHLVNKEFAVEWARLLVGRRYVAMTNKYGGLMAAVSYGVGQPMGALSSWASLAITHHLLVQFAAWDAGVVPAGTWFTGYAVLGDDLVIFDQRVKVAYLRILDALGVECGIAKSLLSPDGSAIEFAKRIFYKGVDTTPPSITEFLAANLTLAEAIAFARKHSLSFTQLLSALGYGYRVLGSVNKHVGTLNSRVRALLFAYHIPLNEEQATETLFRGNPLISQTQLAEVVEEFKRLLMGRYLAIIKKRLSNLVSTPDAIKAASEKALNSVITRIYLVGFLQAYLDHVLPGEGSGLPVPYEEHDGPDGFKIRPEVGLSSEDGLCTTAIPPVPLKKVLGSGHYKPPKLISVPPQVFNRVQGNVQDWMLTLNRVSKLVLEPALMSMRTGALEAIDAIGDIRWAKQAWDPSLMQYRTEIYAVYAKALTALRALSRVGLNVPMERDKDEVKRISMDPVQMRF